MTIHFSSNNISSLHNYDLRQRKVLLKTAEKKLNTPQKLLLNIVKLSILVPMFLYSVWLTSWNMLLPITLATITYLLIYRPLFLFLLQPHLNKIIEAKNRKNSDSD